MFDPSKVTKVYSGRKGCACGCRGKYTYTCRDARPSYYSGDDGVNPKVVQRMVAKVDKFMRDPSSDVARVYVDDDFFAVDMGNDRTYTVYFD